MNNAKDNLSITEFGWTFKWKRISNTILEAISTYLTKIDEMKLKESVKLAEEVSLEIEEADLVACCRKIKKSITGKAMICDLGPINLFVVSNASMRPVQDSAIAYSITTEEALDPLHSAADFFKCIKQLHLDSQYEMVMFNEIVTMSYGVVEKKCPPKKIVNNKDSKANGIDLDIDFSRYSSDDMGLWWQKWGGYLFEMELVNTDGKQKKNRHILNYCVGNYSIDPSMIQM